MVDFQVKKLTKRAELEEPDRLSQLPEPIIVYILSFLSTEEASRTSVLSREWRWRWLFVDEFNFNTSRFINTQTLEFTRTSHDVSVVRGLFFEWVNTVLESRRVHVEEASRLNRLRFQFPLELDSWYKMKIDKWLDFAFAKRVQSLELDLFRCSKTTSIRSNISCGYYLPRRFLTETETDFSFLKSLSLSGVNVSREDIDSLLLRFRFLEHLKLCWPYLLNSIEIGSSSSLKHLEIIHCNMSSITVRDTCLVSLAVTWVDSLVLNNNPKLVSVCVSESLNIGLFVNHGAQIQMLSSCLSRLHTLSLDLNYSNDDENLDQVPELLELKELTLIVDPDLKGTLLRLTTLLSLSPKLEKLALGFVNMSSARLGRKKASKKGPFPLEHLKAIEVRGYIGKSGDQLLKCIFQHIVAPLERIIFVPHASRPDYCSPCNVPKSETSVEQRVELLKGVVEMGAKRFKRAKKRVMSSEVEFIVKN